MTGLRTMNGRKNGRQPSPVRGRLWDVMLGLGLVVAAGVVVSDVRLFGATPETGSPLGWFAALALIGVVVLGYVLLRRLSAPSAPAAHAGGFEVFDSCPDGRVIADAEGVVVYANAAWHRLVGELPDDGSASVTRLFSGRHATRAGLERLESALAHGRGAAEVLELSGLGAPVSFPVSVYPLGGQPGASVWCAAPPRPDLTTGGGSSLAGALDALPVGLCLTGEEGRIVFVNQVLADWVGVRPVDLLESRVAFEDLLLDDRDAAGPRREDAFDGQHDVAVRGRGGEALYTRITRSAIASGDGQACLCYVVHQPVSERDRIETLFQVGNRFHHFFDFAPVGIVMLDRSGLVVAANAKFSAMIGETEAMTEGRALVDLVHESDHHALDTCINAAGTGDSLPAPVELRLRGANDGVAQAYVRAVGQGDAASHIVYLVDWTAQKNLERQFVQSQKMQAVGQLAGGIAHDFNNLLTAMIGFCDLLLIRHPVGDETFVDIMQIKQNANRAANLVRQLLAFSRQQTLQPRRLDLTDVLAELSHLLRRLLGETIELKMIHGRDLGVVIGDQGQLEQVIINLAVNARDAMAPGGTLTISTRNELRQAAAEVGHEVLPAGEYVVIEVGDTGPGIPEAHLNKIFEPFFTTKEAGAGVGLGLSTVYGIVKQTGGFIVPSNGPDGGAIFRIYLPGHAEEADTVEESRPRAPGQDLTGTGTILLVEDEAPVRQFALRALRNKGYEVLPAEGGAEALGILDQHEDAIDLIITDVGMPRMDGPSLVRQALERWPDLKVLLISGYAEDSMRPNLAGGFSAGFLAKPFSLKELAGKVKEVLEGPRP